MFKLDKNLENDTQFVCKLNSCQVLIKINDELPWLILVPEISNVTELTDLDDLQYEQVMQEVKYCANILKKLFHPDKLNIANLGNIVPQLHIHIICRFRDDRAWPNPVWGTKANSASNMKFTRMSTGEMIKLILDNI